MHRRQWIYQSAFGLGSAALGQLLAADANRRGPHHAPKADACIFLGMLGGVSQIDTFDPKPKLVELNGKIMDWSKEKKTDQPNLFAKPRKFVASPFKFQKYGKCGREVSELLPRTAQCVDDLAVVRSVQSDNGNHPAAVFQMNTGFIVPGNPSMGAWVTYGLGTANKNLPAFVAMPDFRSIPFSGAQQWGSGYLPAEYQGTVLRAASEPIRDLASPANVDGSLISAEREVLRRLNDVYRESHPDNADLQARIDSYELAYRMQMEVPRVLSIDSEPEAVKDAYGLNDPGTASFGRRCLMARKLVEAGVRFVEIFTPSQSWDAHGDIRKNHEKNARETDKPIAALLKDLKQRGMLARTLVVYMGEFGRTPDTPADQETPGRDHNTRCQSMWLAGGGVQGGSIIGTTDEIGHKAVEDIYHMHDVHATILNQMGLNDMRLTYYFAGRNRRLTDLGGRPIKEILA
ncbi:MAG: DUF1501 domain-containing protein [Acidobacteria bacterium]|nr:DUF1501 domain-containing protein [Acidobacteriota bacterium]